MAKLWLHNKEPKTSQWSDTNPDVNDPDWVEVSSDIWSCYRWGLRAGIDIYDFENHLKSIYDGNWSTKNDLEKLALASFCIADKADRDTISFEPEVHMTGDYANHEFGIHDFVRDEFKHLTINEIDYTSVKQLNTHLQRKNTWAIGRLVKVEYFQTYDHVTDLGTNKVLEVDITYNLNGYNQLVSRDTVRKWFLRDETIIGVQTSSHKTYDYVSGVVEGLRRRGNNLNKMKVDVPGLIMATEGVDLPTAQTMGIPMFSLYSVEFANYVEVTDPTIQTSLTNDTNFTWLNNIIDDNGTTIKQYLILQLV